MSATNTLAAPVSKTKWIVQIVVTAIVLGNIVALVFAILGITKVDTDLPTAEKYYKWAWIAYAIGVVLWIIGGILYFVALAAILGSAATTGTYGG